MGIDGNKKKEGKKCAVKMSFKLRKSGWVTNGRCLKCGGLYITLKNNLHVRHGTPPPPRNCLTIKARCSGLLLGCDKYSCEKWQ